MTLGGGRRDVTNVTFFVFFKASIHNLNLLFLSNIETSQSTGDYLTIYNMQDSSPTIATAAIAIGTGGSKICGNFWNIADAAAAIAQGTICTYTTPFKVRAFNCFLSISVFLQLLTSNVLKSFRVQLYCGMFLLKLRLPSKINFKKAEQNSTVCTKEQTQVKGSDHRWQGFQSIKIITRTNLTVHFLANIIL